MPFNAIRENKILEKISEFTVFYITKDILKIVFIGNNYLFKDT